MTDISLPNGWRVVDLGETALYGELVDGEFFVRFVRTAPYFGGDHMHGVYRLENGAAITEFERLGRPDKADNVLQDRINRYDDD